MRILTHIENVEAMWGVVASYHVPLILVIPRECSDAIGFKAEVDMSMRCRMIKETLQNSFAVCLDVEEATEFDMFWVLRRKTFLQVCTDEIAVALERRAVNFREALPQAVNEAVVLLWRMWCANNVSALQINNAIDTKASKHRHGVDLLHM